MDEDESREFIELNLVSACVGEETPAFATISREPVVPFEWWSPVSAGAGGRFPAGSVAFEVWAECRGEMCVEVLVRPGGAP